MLCLGVEKAPRGFIAAVRLRGVADRDGPRCQPGVLRAAGAGAARTTDATVDDLADVSVKNHRHAVDNPNAMYRKEVSREEVLASRAVCPPLTLLMLCAPNEGAAAAVLMSRPRRPAAEASTARSLRAVSCPARPDDWFVPAPSFPTDARTSLTERAAAPAYEQAGIGPDDVDLVECQDTDAASELLAYRDLCSVPPVTRRSSCARATRRWAAACR